MTTETGQIKDGLSFGPFHLIASERLLTREGVPIELGARALEILVVLISTPNEIVSKKDLMSRVWPDVIVEEGSLRFHVARLRKALGDGQDGARYITTLPGRGYCFVAPVSQLSSPRDGSLVVTANFSHANLPSRLSRMVGRDDDVLKLSAQLNASRFVTIVGAGGVGKTTVAIAVGHHLIEAFSGAVLFVDLGMLGDPDLVTTAVASMLGLSVQSNDATPNLIAYLRNRRILLILDTCEHLVDAVATLAASIIDASSQVHILATSREALRVESEHIYRLDALACPPDDPGLTAAVVQTFPATQLFVERAVASGARLDVSDAEALLVASICRKLDGVALAIELAARRVESYGLQQTAALLDQRLTLLWLGSRTAPPRQQTLQAMLDWSFGLLTELERAVLRRLAIFVGHFTLDAALEVVTNAALDRSTVFSAVDSLVAKSIVATRPIGAMMRYRLLDTTRAYVLEIKIDDAESADLAVRHAAYYRRWLEQTGLEWPNLATGEQRTPHFAAINNVRAALEWCFGDNGNAVIGIGLAVAAAPVFLAMSLLPECHRWSERAIFALDVAELGGLDEMHLQAALGVSLMFMRGGRDAARVALERSFAIAEERGDALDQVRLLGPLNMFHLRTGNFTTALQCAKRCSATATTTEDSVAIALAHSILGISLHLRGDLADARAELEAALDRGPRAQRTTTIYLGFEGKILAKAILARNLWLQGHPDRAMECARQAVEEAAAMDHSLTLAIALIWAISVFLWTGELEHAEAYIDMLISRAESHSMAPYLLVGRGFKGEVAIRRGDAEGGVESLRSSLQKLHAAPYELLTTELNLSLASGLSAIGQVDEAVALLDESLGRVEANGDLLYVPELLRMKGTILLLQSEFHRDEAEACLLQALELSHHQEARAWELRTAIDVATLMGSRGEIDSARELLQPVFEHFVEGLDTADVKVAEHLLVTLR
ncbi:ATP-binding protein [Rhizobium sp. BK313]|uniref:ATP-binding protein n=1 Tax=Rhizobium sp. BK313 TaxID=2587081 RepID=UPI001060D3D9|nr:winged helix-turn-helix domain-containing protein [Rhizobium sp. BK313]